MSIPSTQAPTNPIRLIGLIRLISLTTCLMIYLLWSVQSVAANPLSRVEVSSETMDLLQRDVQRVLDNAVEAMSDTPDVLPGVTAAFLLPGEQLAGFAAGHADLENGVAMHVDHLMPAGSVGKIFVAAVVLSLLEDELLDLDEPIARWLGGEAWFSRLPNHQTLTLRHLLNHSGGIADHVFDEGSDFGVWFTAALNAPDSQIICNHTQDLLDQAFDPARLVQFVLDRDPLFKPGEGYHYTDTGYILAGLIIEKAAGTSYYQLLTERFLEPLELSLSTPQNRRHIDDLAQGYAVESSDMLGLPGRMLTDGRLVFNPLIEWTGGGVVSNSQDLVKWITALFESIVLSRRSVDQMLNSISHNGMSQDSASRALGYGLGISVVQTDVGTAYRHGGFFPGYVSMVAYYPDYGIALAMQINSDSADLETLFNAVRDTIFTTPGVVD